MFRKKGALRKYLISYMGLAVSLCAILGLVLLMMASSSLNRQEEASIRDRLASACEDFCYQIDSLQELTLQIRTKYTYQPYYLQKNSWNEMEMLKEFAKITGFIPLAQDYYLYYEDFSCVYSTFSKQPFSLFVSQLLPDWSEERIQQDIQSGQPFLTYDADREPVILCSFPIAFNRYSQNMRAFLLVRLDASALRSRYENMFRLNGPLEITVNGQPVLGGASPDAPLSYLQDTGKYAVCFSLSELNLSGTSAIGGMLAILVFLSLLFAAVSAALAYQNYLPIKRLASKVGHAETENENEIQSIARAVDQYIQQNSDSMTALTESLESISRLKDALRQQVLLRLLSGEYDPSLEQRLADSGLDLRGSHFCVAHIVHAPSLSTEALRRQIVTLSDEDVKLYLTQLAGSRGWALLLCAREEQNLLAAYDALSDALSERFPHLSIRMGQTCCQVQKLAFSLAVAESAQAQERPDPAEDDQSMLNRVCKCLAEGDESGALENLDQLLDRLDETYPSALFRRYRAVEVRHQLIECGKSLGCPLESEELHSSMARLDADNVRAVMSQLVHRICAAVPRKTEKLSPSAQIVLEYMEQHAMDYEVCLDSAAQACGISTKQVSRIVRSSTGVSFKEYISHQRMRRAKQLLKEGLSSTETANAVGYADVSYFTKVFRAYHGYTPGQYRDQILENAREHEEE